LRRGLLDNGYGESPIGGEHGVAILCPNLSGPSARQRRH
jgi:hypothetical protein